MGAETPEGRPGGAARAVTREDHGPVRRMPRSASSRNGRIRTGDVAVGCMRRNVRTGGSGVFLVCAFVSPEM